MRGRVRSSTFLVVCFTAGSNRRTPAIAGGPSDGVVHDQGTPCYGRQLGAPSFEGLRVTRVWWEPSACMT